MTATKIISSLAALLSLAACTVATGGAGESAPAPGSEKAVLFTEASPEALASALGEGRIQFHPGESNEAVSSALSAYLRDGAGVTPVKGDVSRRITPEMTCWHCYGECSGGNSKCDCFAVPCPKPPPSQMF